MKVLIAGIAAFCMVAPAAAREGTAAQQAEAVTRVVAEPVGGDVAETVPESEAVAPDVVPARTLPSSTLITIASDSEISSKKIELGDVFTFSVVEDVSENGEVVIPRGSKADAEVTFKTGRAIGGKSGKFELTFAKLHIGETEYALSGTHRQEGKGNTAAAVLASWLISGRSAVMLEGQTVTALTAEPIPY
ncbi:hypothetical protein [Croceicoccus bisphenolivorans]|uniref:hypothetical protein n=1 Tax=Croceicoccus bisphenolivorans TaxID=1783232 RepID=UPI00082E6463|nr:hypothetical protein [Croceicoccus bisphenolivorans]